MQHALGLAASPRVLDILIVGGGYFSGACSQRTDLQPESIRLHSACTLHARWLPLSHVSDLVLNEVARNGA